MIKTFFSGLLRLLLKLCLIGVVGTAVLFVVYFFNLDMKLTAKMEPLLTWVYDNKVKRDQHL
jgi:putative flippase GtrA